MRPKDFRKLLKLVPGATPVLVLWEGHYYNAFIDNGILVFATKAELHRFLDEGAMFGPKSGLSLIYLDSIKVDEFKKFVFRESFK